MECALVPPWAAFCLCDLLTGTKSARRKLHRGVRASRLGDGMRNKEPWPPQGPASSGTAVFRVVVGGPSLGSVRERQGGRLLVMVIVGSTGHLVGTGARC